MPVVNLTTIELATYGNTEFKVMNGTYYVKDTPDDVVRVLERVRLTHLRVHIFLGDADTGRDWLEENDVTGTISRSMGPVRAPIMVNNSRSMGGSIILTDSIVRIITSDKVQLYRHPTYNLPQLTIGPGWDRNYPFGVFADGETRAGFETEAQANRWIAFMKGERGAK